MVSLDSEGAGFPLHMPYTHWTDSAYSGSQVMASVMSLQQGWKPEDQPSFEGIFIPPHQALYAHLCLVTVKGSFKPLRDSVNSGESKAT